MNKIILKSALYGLLGTVLLLVFYFTVVTFVSGLVFTISQFEMFWYFIASLALGFGIQIGLYVYLKNTIHQKAGGGAMAVSGTTSTIAMLSCCAHYLANLLPVLGTVGLVTFVAQYQIELFWVGLLFNAGGIVYISSKIIKFKKNL
ncbi:MAG: hypothetical protein US50_C0056G0004 [Candidatus Nomurabacteria bacterium GW2011_GWB1_37_5]|uniref:Uncharacterized protein n=1 Tax=Candidatus Nomurabacteria bacterium GW2011_GWB1_37_5 TaxID=1618742 RepID=A0A0G0K0S6_9BACT|nr:MAG: hypothetical protein US50_C0056G0004 [Candidatus Nomurabacteria bacterium GW2011_GWB1_37_5]